ncbi:MAG TPA: FAD-dependent oxidoreductase [Candidatus Udaeobacter sp.]|nr:FAD-dependent oxidoreductase [Candidatus Udaeobacter sp.]
MAPERIEVACCIAGGGPAGMMLGLLLARGGVEVLVLEKHGDFLRDFRGDTIHPSTLEVMHELDLLDAFLRLPHEKIATLSGQVGAESLQIADFRHLPTRCKFVALMPQWDFLAFLAGAAKPYPGFRLRMLSEASELIGADGRIVGLRAKTPDGMLEIRAGLVVAADGRHSTLRGQAGLEVMDLGAPMDVLWLRLSRRASDPAQTLGRFDGGRIMVMLNRGSYWQCAFVIPKGGIEAIRAAGLPAFREAVAGMAPYLADRLGELASWDDVKLLTVAVDRLRRWHRPGLLCIGDAAHAMSPIGGVGINLAIQDAVATANLLGPSLLRGAASDDALAAVQRRRIFPTAMTQRLQVMVQNRVISPVLAGAPTTALPFPLRLIRRFPVLTRLPARLLGLGFLPEHVRFHPA